MSRESERVQKALTVTDSKVHNCCLKLSLRIFVNHIQQPNFALFVAETRPDNSLSVTTIQVSGEAPGDDAGS